MAHGMDMGFWYCHSCIGWLVTVFSCHKKLIQEFFVAKILLRVLKRGEVQKRGTPLLVHVSIGGRCGTSFAITISGVFAYANTPLPLPMLYDEKNNVKFVRKVPGCGCIPLCRCYNISEVKENTSMTELLF